MTIWPIWMMTRIMKTSVGKPIDNHKLLSQINEDSGMTAVCHKVNYSPNSDNMEILFCTALSDAEQTTLDTIISNHNYDQ